jgi:hypothetical protein
MGCTTTRRQRRLRTGEQANSCINNCGELLCPVSAQQLCIRVSIRPEAGNARSKKLIVELAKLGGLLVKKKRKECISAAQRDARNRVQQRAWKYDCAARRRPLNFRGPYAGKLKSPPSKSELPNGKSRQACQPRPARSPASRIRATMTKASRWPVSQSGGVIDDKGS